MANTDLFETIPVTEVYSAPRGRQAKLNEKLVEGFSKMKPGQAAIVKVFGPVAKEQHSSVSQKIRAHWSAGRNDECDIRWTADGQFPQVAVKGSIPTKAKAKA